MKVTKNLGMLLLAAWLILTGLIPSAQFRLLGTGHGDGDPRHRGRRLDRRGAIRAGVLRVPLARMAERRDPRYFASFLAFRYQSGILCRLDDSCRARAPGRRFGFPDWHAAGN